MVMKFAACVNPRVLKFEHLTINDFWCSEIISRFVARQSHKWQIVFRGCEVVMTSLALRTSISRVTFYYANMSVTSVQLVRALNPQRLEFKYVNVVNSFDDVIVNSVASCTHLYGLVMNFTIDNDVIQCRNGFFTILELLKARGLPAYVYFESFALGHATLSFFRHRVQFEDVDLYIPTRRAGLETIWRPLIYRPENMIILFDVDVRYNLVPFFVHA